MNPNDIISYLDLVNEEHAHLQKGMNYRVGKQYSVFLMSMYGKAHLLSDASETLNVYFRADQTHRRFI